jgi:hypothetical protein
LKRKTGKIFFNLRKALKTGAFLIFPASDSKTGTALAYIETESEKRKV